jgi:hypothetical protein
MQNQQQQIEYAAMLQKNAQQGAAAFGMGGGGASVGDGSTNSSKNQNDSDLQRQTTAEILLEAAGELGTNLESTGARFLAAAQLEGDISKREEV